MTKSSPTTRSAASLIKLGGLVQLRPCLGFDDGFRDVGYTYSHDRHKDWSADRIDQNV